MPSMAISSFPLPRPSPPPLLPTPSDPDLVRSLLRLSREISLYEPPKSLQNRSFSSISRKSALLAAFFEELLRDPIPDLPRSASLCLKEILLVFQRFKALLGDCSTRSRMRLLLQAETVANEFHELTLELSTLLDILPLGELDVGEDVRDLVDGAMLGGGGGVRGQNCVRGGASVRAEPVGETGVGADGAGAPADGDGGGRFLPESAGGVGGGRGGVPAYD